MINSIFLITSNFLPSDAKQFITPFYNPPPRRLSTTSKPRSSQLTLLLLIPFSQSALNSQTLPILSHQSTNPSNR